MITLRSGLPPELVPLSWLLGVWEGSGVLDYKVGDTSVQAEFGHRISFSYDGLPYLNYNSYTWLFESDSDGAPQPLVSEMGYWRLSRPLIDADAGPAMLPGRGEPAFPDAESVETLRNDVGGFDIDVSLVHPDGVGELYLGQVNGPRIDLATDAVMRTAAAKDYAAATRLYGLVDEHLLWAWDIAALGQSLRSHASGRLARVD
ncbi:FABP family protein [Rathayibacter toxicus]|uniref:FABP family protein n=1 Tax=Rathayibacter toxicus TaxID=145458 RepID=UPI000CE7ABE7|nr:FABP family protein [Rathayibacter toxicus]PPI56205.1 FABP family protein [Rathayibacter toxicus]QOD09997.1 FABP family protein [Rathayibacter toxicus]QWL28672.1 FABP family protein [Rathayibacter toxicus]